LNNDNDIINEFTGKYNFLSNFYPVPIDTGRRTYASVEHYYQAMKSMPGEIIEVKENNVLVKKTARQWVSEAKTPGEAKKRGKKVPLRSDWEIIKIPVMKWGLRRKFTQAEMAAKLLDTKNKILIEGNWWHDNFWGNCTCSKCQNPHGKNNLGELLMMIRNEVKNQKILIKRR